MSRFVYKLSNHLTGVVFCSKKPLLSNDTTFPTLASAMFFITNTDDGWNYKTKTHAVISGLSF